MRYLKLALLLLAACTSEFEARKHYDTSMQPIWTECKQEVGPEPTSTAAVETQKFHATEEWQSWHLAYGLSRQGACRRRRGIDGAPSMIPWFVRQCWRDRALVGTLAVAVIFIAWTALSSVALTRMLAVRDYYPFSEPDSYWQWWSYLLDADQPLSIDKWLLASGIIGTPTMGRAASQGAAGP